MAKMKKANIPVGYLRTVEEGFNAPEVRDRHRLSQIPHPTAGSVPNIETPLHMSLTPTIDPVAAPLLGEHTREVLRRRSVTMTAVSRPWPRRGLSERPAIPADRRPRAGRWAVTKSPCVRPENAPTLTFLATIEIDAA